MALVAGRGMVNLGPRCVISAHKLHVEMDPYRFGGGLSLGGALLVRQRQAPVTKGCRVFQVQWGGIVLAEINIPTGTPEDEREQVFEDTKLLVRMRWGSP